MEFYWAVPCDVWTGRENTFRSSTCLFWELFKRGREKSFVTITAHLLISSTLLCVVPPFHPPPSDRRLRCVNNAWMVSVPSCSSLNNAQRHLWAQLFVKHIRDASGNNMIPRGHSLGARLLQHLCCNIRRKQGGGDHVVDALLNSLSSEAHFPQPHWLLDR